ncbi:MAG: flagellar hook-basal body complex protein FliE [Desulfobacterales bacterium]|nr:flagellar hook-basal body complex protein FliE [Desulfobacterales bacterium]
MMNDIQLSKGIEQAMPSAAPGHRQASAETGFGEMLGKAIETVNQHHLEADQASVDLATGRSSDVHHAMIAIEKADVSFRMLMQVRNKIVSAYETVMRTQI